MEESRDSLEKRLRTLMVEHVLAVRRNPDGDHSQRAKQIKELQDAIAKTY
jgi:hypothetical protein